MDSLTTVKALLPTSVLSALEEMARQENTTQTNVMCLSVLLRHELRKAAQAGETVLIRGKDGTIRGKDGTLYELTIT